MVKDNIYILFVMNKIIWYIIIKDLIPIIILC